MKLKEGSKRQPLGRKYKIQKKAREHTRKMRKIAKTAPVKKSKRKESGIPNNWPFKAEWLRHIQQQRERDAQEKKERREALRQQQIALKEQEKSASKKGSRAAAGAGGAAADEEDEWEDVPDDDDDDVIDEEMDDEPAPKRKKTSREQTGAAGKKSALPPFADPSGAAFNVTKGVTYEMLAADAAQRQGLFGPAGAGPQPEAQTKTADYRGESSRKSWYKDLQKVVNESDIVVEVLDARDPNSCRCRELERSIVAQSKKLVVVLNKIDLIPKSALEAWLKYLRREYPTIAFKAALGGDKVRHAKTSAQQASDALLKSGSAVVGADALMQLVKNYARTGSSNVAKSKQSMSVGIIGYPNVGKSSIINSLKRANNVVKVGAEAGVTRGVQEVQLDAKVKLIDSPGVVFGKNENDPSTVLRNAVKISLVKDPLTVVEALLQRCPKPSLMKFFQVPVYEDASELLAEVARARGKLKRGGSPDIDAAARHVLTEWVSGKIRYYTMPPHEQPSEHEHAEIVSSWGADFNIDAIFAQNDAEMRDQEMEATSSSSQHTVAMELSSAGFGDAMMDHDGPAAAAAGVGEFLMDDRRHSDKKGKRTAAAAAAGEMMTDGPSSSTPQPRRGTEADFDIKKKRRRSVLRGGDELSKLKSPAIPPNMKRVEKQMRKNRRREKARALEDEQNRMTDDSGHTAAISHTAAAGKGKGGKKGGKGTDEDIIMA
ncbi:unnamed protein product [Vitrella brassicaformis CCMP3155]|uniref:CP-type G domain-containing protein n=1 Tax=Vitrella brassicaformis (strain CCMP3155) TaxID=1169540 RepID=A0A0G4G0Q7_VITBC|nr:unnamed protein product [Vitrella brassicaformis CCMP3155]|eukprot:CEM21124.1 unnamed protein product [Vitrella brassicaformis CCMP3155]